MFLEQQITRAGRLAVDPVIRAHDRSGSGLDDGGAERGEIGILQVMRRDEDIRAVARGFRAAMHGEVLRCRDHIRQIGVRTLHALHEGDSQPRGEIGILAVCFLTATPARITEDVDVGRPCVEAGADPPGLAGLPC